MHLRLDLTGSCYAGDMRHAQEIMKDLGIKYSHSTPQSLYDCWWFWNCINVPDKLPDFIDEIKVNPMDAIGYGLSKERAEEIIRIQNANSRDNVRMSEGADK